MLLISADFYLVSIVSFMLFSSVLVLMFWAIDEKVTPFYFQKNVASVYIIFLMLLSTYLFSETMFYTDLSANLPAVWKGSTWVFKYFEGTMTYLPSTKSFFTLTYADSTAGMFSNTVFTAYVRMGILIASVVSLLACIAYLDSVKYNFFEFFIFLFYSTVAMTILVSSSNALLTYLSIELQSLSLYLMASSQRKSIHSVESGLKYMFIGSLASGTLLLGFSYLYLLTGSLNFFDINDILVKYNEFYTWMESLDVEGYAFYLINPYLIYYFIFGASLIIFSLFLKLAVAPFHMWLADVYEGSPTATTIYYLIVPKIAILAVFYRVTHDVFDWGFYGQDICPNVFTTLSPMIMFCIFYSFLVGYSGMLKPGITLKRFFAFSGIGHLGFMLLPYTSSLFYDYSFELAEYNILYSLVFYVCLYVLIIIPSARMLLMFVNPDNKNSSSRNIHYVIENLPVNYHLISPSNGLFVFMLSMIFVGIPPTAGFFMKLYPLTVTLISPSFLVFLVWPAILFSSYVYVRIVVVLFFKNVNEWAPRSWSSTSNSGYLMTLVSIISVLFLMTYVLHFDFIGAIALDMSLVN